MKNAAAALAAGLIALIVYLVTLCPTMYAGDSGELAWAAASLGLAHPPGYPVWTLLGRLAVVLSPTGPAVALNATSALFAAGAAGLVALFLSMLTGRALISAGVALAFAFSRGVWSQATVTEVYALNLLLLAAVLVSAIAARRGRPQLLLLAAYLLGLGTANHPLILSAVPAVLWLCAPHLRPSSGGVPRLLAAGGLFALGLSAYIYLPVRWSVGPEMNWGGIRSLTEIWDHVTRTQYGGLGEAGADTSLGMRLRVFASILARSVSVPLLLVGLAGLVHVLRADRRAGVTLLLLFLIAGPLTAAAIRYEDTFLDRSVTSVFFLPAVLAAFIAAGAGLAALDRVVADRLGELRRAAGLVTVVLALVPVLFLYQRNAASCDRSESTLGEIYSRTILESLPQGARLYARGDNAAFLLAYFQRVEGVRPDITLADRTLNLFVDAYGSDFLALSREERKAKAADREVELAYNERSTPTFYTSEMDVTPFGGCRLVPSGLVYQLVRPGETPAVPSYEPIVLPPVDPEDYLETHLAGVALLREARWLVHVGRTEEAHAVLHASAQAASGIASILRNVGLEHLMLGEVVVAEERFLAALEVEPDDEDALYNLATLYAQTDRQGEALERLDRILANGTEYAEVHLSRGVLLVSAGRLEEAGHAAQAALEIEPGLEPAQELQAAVDLGLGIGGEAGVLEARAAVEPVTTGGTLQLAERYLERGELERASDLYREVFQRSPESVAAAYGLGYGLLRLGRLDEAAEAFRRVLDLDPASASGRNALAYVYALSGDSLEIAEGLVEEALELEPGLAAYWNDTLGWVRYRAGDLNGALAALHESERQLPPDDRSMCAENDYHLAVVLLELGRTADGKTYLIRSADRAKDEPWLPDLRARARQLGLELESI